MLKHTKWHWNNFKLRSPQMFVTAVWFSFVLRLLHVVQASIFITMADRNTYMRSTTIVFGFIRVASKWNCPLVRGIDKGFVKVALTVTSSPTESWDTDAYMRQAKLSKCLFIFKNMETILNQDVGLSTFVANLFAPLTRKCLTHWSLISHVENAFF